MKPHRAEFIVSAAKPSQFPKAAALEIAFAGRSNVGKSTLINKLVGVSKLARTSNTPGRTRLINWFRVELRRDKMVDFVDLPGYGYAKVSKDMRAAWRPLIEAYLSGRDALRAVVLLVDARRGAQEDERDLVEWLAEADVPTIVVFTKSDKLPKSKRKPAVLALKRELGLDRPPIAFSAHAGEGIDELWRAILRHVK